MYYFLSWHFAFCTDRTSADKISFANPKLSIVWEGYCLKFGQTNWKCDNKSARLSLRILKRSYNSPIIGVLRGLESNARPLK